MGNLPISAAMRSTEGWRVRAPLFRLEQIRPAGSPQVPSRCLSRARRPARCTQTRGLGGSRRQVQRQLPRPLRGPARAWGWRWRWTSWPYTCTSRTYAAPASSANGVRQPGPGSRSRKANSVARSGVSQLRKTSASPTWIASYDFGQGAGFYVDATEAPYDTRAIHPRQCNGVIGMRLHWHALQCTLNVNVKIARTASSAFVGKVGALEGARRAAAALAVRVN